VPRFLTKIVAGTFQLTGGSPAADKVLASDANGNATWQTNTPADGTVTTAKLADDETDLYVKLSTEVFG
jgi:hypothetical protein